MQRLEVDPTGRTVERVIVDRNGTQETYSADMVVVSCGAVNSAALLLRSTSDKHPDGLANSSDVVGRHYMAHSNSAVIAISKTPNDTRLQKTLALNDYYWGAEDWELPASGHITDARQVRIATSLRSAAAPRFVPGPAARLHRQARPRLLADQPEDLPHSAEPGGPRPPGNIPPHQEPTRNTEAPHERLLG